MQKTIRKRVYDTETAERLSVCNVSYFGDPAGYSETLYRTPDGHYFLHGAGGEESPYKTEQINPCPPPARKNGLPITPAPPIPRNRRKNKRTNHFFRVFTEKSGSTDVEPLFVVCFSITQPR